MKAIDYMKPSPVKRLKITDRTKYTLKNGKTVETMTAGVRRLNKELRNA